MWWCSSASRGRSGSAGVSGLYTYLKTSAGVLNTSIQADWTAGNLAIDDTVSVLGYYEDSNLGGGLYRVVASATGTDDGGSYIDFTGFQLEAVFENGVPAARFGVDPSRTGTVNSAALQAAIDALQTIDDVNSCLVLPAGVTEYGVGVTLNGRPLKIDASAATSHFSGTGYFVTVDSTGSVHPSKSRPFIDGGRWEYTGTGLAGCFNTLDAGSTRFQNLDIQGFTSWAFDIENVDAWTENVDIYNIQIMGGDETAGKGGILRQHGPTGTGTKSQARTIVENVFYNGNAQYPISIETGAYDSSWKNIKGNLGTNVDAVFYLAEATDGSVIEDIKFEGGKPTKQTYYVHIANTTAGRVIAQLRGEFSGLDEINDDPVSIDGSVTNPDWPRGRPTAVWGGLSLPLDEPFMDKIGNQYQPWFRRFDATLTKSTAYELSDKANGAFRVAVKATDLADDSFVIVFECAKAATYLAPTIAKVADNSPGLDTCNITWADTDGLLLTWTGTNVATSTSARITIEAADYIE